jgi:hypothetical protein
LKTPIRRRIELRIDDILNIFKDYCTPDDIPANARPVKLQRNETTRQLALVVESPDFTRDGELVVDFHIKRSYGVNG